MKNLFLFVFLFVSFSIFASETYDPSLAIDKALSQITEGLTPSQKAEFEKAMKEQRAKIDEYKKKSPAEQKKMLEEATSKMKSEDYKKKMMEEYNKMTPEQKDALKKMMQNFKKLQK